MPNALQLQKSAAKEAVTIKGRHAGKKARGVNLLAFFFLFVVAIGLYESLAQGLFPEISLLGAAHRLGALRDYPVSYEPGKGVWHALGWAGSAMMVVMMLYSVRKRVAFLSSIGSMRRWLSAHMFLGVLGPLLVTLHTTFKLHGLVATSFWCMITTMVFGIIGRYIYVQIPRGISGAELGVKELESAVEALDGELGKLLSNRRMENLLAELGVKDAGRYISGLESEPARSLKKSTHLSDLLREISCEGVEAGSLNPLRALFFMMKADVKNRLRLRRFKAVLSGQYGLGRKETDEITALLRGKALLLRKKNLLFASHSLLHYWHVLHVPLAMVMFLIMFVHVLIYYIFRPVH